MFGVSVFFVKHLLSALWANAEEGTRLSNSVKIADFGVRKTWVCVLALPLTSWETLASHTSLTFCILTVRCKSIWIVGRIK